MKVNVNGIEFSLSFEYENSELNELLYSQATEKKMADEGKSREDLLAMKPGELMKFLDMKHLPGPSRVNLVAESNEGFFKVYSCKFNKSSMKKVRSRAASIFKGKENRFMREALVKQIKASKLPVYSKEEARKAALSAFTKDTWPAREDKWIRALFWKTYLERNEKEQVEIPTVEQN